MDFYNNDGADYRQIVKHQVLSPVIKVELLDHYENAYAELIEEISAENIGSISETFKQGVRKSINFTIFDPLGEFIPDPNNKYFWIGRKFKIYLGLTKTRYYSEDNPLLYSYSEADLVAYLKALNPNNWANPMLPIPDSPDDGLIIIGQNNIKSEEDTYWFTKGVYTISNISATHNLANKTVSITGVDKFGLFGSETGYNEMVGTFVIKEGTMLFDAIIDVLNQDMGNGQVLDPIQPIIDPYYRTEYVRADISKGPGTYISEILIDLANSYRADIYYDNDGRLNFWRSMLGEENANLPKVWDFYDTDPEYLNSTLTFNLTKTVNTVYVVGDNPTAATAPVAMSENRNLASPLAIQKVGRRCKYFETSSIKSAVEAQDYANYQLKMLSIVENTISFEATYIPSLEVNKIFTLTDNFYHIIQENFLIESITLPLGLGTTRITGSSLIELPGY